MDNVNKNLPNKGEIQKCHLKIVRSAHVYSSVLLGGSETYTRTHPIQNLQTASINAPEQGQ